MRRAAKFLATIILLICLFICTTAAGLYLLDWNAYLEAIYQEELDSEWPEPFEFYDA